MNLRGHPGLHATASVIPRPFLPVGLAEPSSGTRRFVSRPQAGIVALPGPGISSRRYDGIGASGRDGCVTPFGVTDAVGGDAADPLLHRDLRQQVGQDASPVLSYRMPPGGETIGIRSPVRHPRCGCWSSPPREFPDFQHQFRCGSCATGDGGWLHACGFEPGQKTVRGAVFPAIGHSPSPGKPC